MEEKSIRARSADSSASETPRRTSGNAAAAGARALSASEVRKLLRRSMGDDAQAFDSLASKLLVQTGLFLDHTRLVKCAEAHIGVVAGLRGLEALELEEIQDCIEWAAEDLQRRELKLAKSGEELRDSELEAYGFLINGLCVRRQDARKVKVAYNALSPRIRLAFRRVVLDGEEGAQLVGDGWSSLDQVRGDVLEAVGVILGRELRVR